MAILKTTMKMFTIAVFVLSLALFLETLGVNTFRHSVFSLGGLVYFTAIAYGWWQFSQPQ